MTMRTFFLSVTLVVFSLISQSAKASAMDEKCPESPTTGMGQPPVVLYKAASGATVLVCGNDEGLVNDLTQRHKVTDFEIIARFSSGAQKILFTSKHEKTYFVWIDSNGALGLQEWGAGVAYFQKYITCGNASCAFSRETCSIVKRAKIYNYVVRDVQAQLQEKGELQDVFLDNLIEELEIQTIAGDRQAYSMLFNPVLTKGARGPASVSLRSSQDDIRRLWALKCFR
jgi:hypothetical protein